MKWRFVAPERHQEMPRYPILVIALAAAAALAAGCSAPGSRSGSVTAAELERALAKNQAGATEIDCDPDVNGWDYTCLFTDLTGGRMKIGLLVTGGQVTRVSAPVSAKSSLTAPREHAEGPEGRWIDELDIACFKATNEMRAVARPQTEAEFQRYVGALRKIGLKYRRDLSALPPAPRTQDRKTFAQLLRLLGDDERSVRLLQNAVRRRDRNRIERLFEGMGKRNAKENALFNRLGGDCP